MKKYALACLLATISSVSVAQKFPGPIIAAFYMETMSTPKGWQLAYKGQENKVQVFTMSRDLDAHPQTAMLQPIDQIRRLMCGEDELKAMIKSGVKVRIDARDKKNGTVQVTKGPVLSSC